jgi:hypothetical protein
MLPLEFLEYCAQNYEEKYKKCGNEYQRNKFFELGLVFLLLSFKIRNRQILVQWKQGKNDLTRQDIQEFVKSQKIMTNVDIRKKRIQFQDFESLKRADKEEQENAKEKKGKLQAQRYKMQVLGRLY